MPGAVKPDSVSDEAVLIPPTVTQPATIASIEAGNAHDNYEALKSWALGMRQWAENAKLDHAAGQPIQPHPKKPAVYRIKVTYADQAGAVKTGPKADDGGFYAWVETIVT